MRLNGPDKPVETFESSAQYLRAIGRADLLTFRGRLIDVARRNGVEMVLTALFTR